MVAGINLRSGRLRRAARV